jgi:ParB-like chromosome segregation protein Spo0J
MATARRSTKLDHKDSKIEKILDEHGITFEYRDAVPIAEIERHPDSQSRLRQVDTSRVLSYATAMKEGAVFPPIVVSQDGFDGFRIVDGDGRVSANKRRKITTIPAYVVRGRP